MSEQRRESHTQKTPQRHIAAGIVSGLAGCGCGLFLLVLVLAGSISAAATLDPVVMLIQPFLIVLSGVILACMIILNLKTQKCCNLRGLRAQRKLVVAAVAIYLLMLFLFLFVIQPYVMGAVDRFMPM
jgi:FtsH-binding integral membrane protein